MLNKAFLFGHNPLSVLMIALAFNAAAWAVTMILAYTSDGDFSKPTGFMKFWVVTAFLLYAWAIACGDICGTLGNQCR